MIVRLFLWNLGDSKTTLQELRQHLPRAIEPDSWISNAGSERFGLITFGATPDADLRRVRDLIGKDPDGAEEFETEA